MKNSYLNSNMNRMKCYVSSLSMTTKLILVMLFFALIKQIFLQSLPILAMPAAGHDDKLMVDMAISLLNGEWLGEYSAMTLVKGVSFPVYLAIIHILGIPYMTATTFLYSSSCIIFVLGIKSLFKSNKTIITLYLILLFCPISFADQTFARMYRNSITAAQILIVLGAISAIYLNIKKSKPFIVWSLIASISFAFFWFTREDSIWLVPFILCASLISLVTIFKDKKVNISFKVKNSFLILLPFITLLLANVVISSFNLKYYGLFTTNELNDSSFADAMKKIYAVEPSEDISYVSVPRSTVKKLYQFSPTLKSIEPYWEKELEIWDDLAGKKLGDGEVEDGWFFWSLRAAVADAGYYSDAQEADVFYSKVTKELEEAFKTGKIQSRITMPSSLMSPWKFEYLQKIPLRLLDACDNIIRFNDMGVSINRGIDDNSGGLRTFEFLSNNLVIGQNEDISHLMLRYSAFRVKGLNYILIFYKMLGPILAGLGLVSYIILTGVFIKKRKTEIYSDVFNTWIISTGLLGSFIVLLMGVVYTDVSAYYAINYLYLAGAYPIFICFSMICLGFLLEFFVRKKRLDKRKL